MFQFKEPWDEPVNGAALTKQFESELHPSRYLYKFKGQFFSVAKNESNDDVIFEIREMGFVLVHLTWSSNEPSTDYPRLKMLDMESDVQEIIDRDNEDF